MAALRQNTVFLLTVVNLSLLNLLHHFPSAGTWTETRSCITCIAAQLLAPRGAAAMERDGARAADGEAGGRFDASRQISHNVRVPSGASGECLAGRACRTATPPLRVCVLGVRLRVQRRARTRAQAQLRTCPRHATARWTGRLGARGAPAPP